MSIATGRVPVSGRVPASGRVAASGRVSAASRIAVDFPLTLVGQGLQGFWRPDPGFVSAPSNVIGQVDDRSGFARHATQPGIGTLRPTLTPNWRNGQPAMSFDGGDRLQIPSSLLTADNWTIWAVYEITSLATTRCVFTVGTTGGVGLTFAESASNRHVRVVGVAVCDDGPAVTTPEMLIVSREAGTLHMYLSTGEVALSTPTVVPTGPTGNSAIGSLSSTSSTFPLIGNVAEVGAFQSGFLSPSQRASLFSYAAARYGI